AHGQGAHRRRQVKVPHLRPYSEPIKVACYSGRTRAERPLRLTWHGTDLLVRDIEKEWQEPGHRLFRVRTQDNRLFELCYNERHHTWTGTELVER
ncbi:MAG: hypothetical protein AB1603_01115, partial [Chloroflexota bacterium]